MNQVTLDEPGQFSFSATAEAPTLAPGEALVKVHRIGVCGTDLHAHAGKQPFFEYPRVLGHELGVEVIDPGSDPLGLSVGDKCSVEPYLNCGKCIACRRGKPNCCTSLKVLGVHTDGGMGDLLAVPAHKLHRSDTLGYDQLALVETLGIGAHAVERAEPTADDFILVIGAGPIGLSVIQFAQISGATVAVMDISESRLAFCREHMGVTHTLVAGPDTADKLTEIGEGDLPTIVIDATGNPRSMAGAFDLPANGGRIVFVGLFQGELAFNDPNFHRRELTVCASRNALPGTFTSIINLMEMGTIDTTPWITHRVALANLPAEFDGIAKDATLLKCMIEF
ncbi:MAG: zinc-binding alcohol dehydrogenase family protein [Verrucomicrobiia bacterium]|tara:strand:- start:3626 stop:4639 length:1014 start_codon:yes stop_codon:yes gene_type:complete